MAHSFELKLDAVLNALLEGSDKPKHDACYYKAKRAYKGKFPSAYASGYMVQCREKGAENYGQSVSEGKFDLERERGLKGWFDRNQGKGWVDCKASRKGHLVPCGRSKTGPGADRSYPACRPTLSACTGTKKKKKSSRPIKWD